MDRIEDVEVLRESYGAPSERALKKQLSRLDKYCRDFIAARRSSSSLQPMLGVGATRPRRVTRLALSK
jgi:hypothetical protein